MAKQLQLRGGTTTEHSTFTGAEREVTVDTTKDTLVVHDGSTAGGIPLATESYTDSAISNLVDSAPGTLDTLNELAAALGDDANFSTTVTNSIATKLPLAGGTMTGNIVFNAGQTFDGRDVSADGSKLDGIESGATADQTASEILTAIKTVDGSGSGLDADTVDGTELSAITHSGDSITLSGDVSGSTTVASDGSISIITTVADDSHNHTVSNVDGLQTYLTKLDGIEAGATADQTASEIKTAYESNADTNALTDALLSKLNTIESNATADQTASEILTAIKTVDGSGSGLDADTLDGVQGSNYARTDVAETFGSSVTATSFIGDGSGLTGIEGVPSGCILMWSGSVATIPSGWYLCDGNNGTPNLMDRMVIGAGSTYSVDGTGGSADAVAVSHTHTGSTSTTGAHTHSITSGGDSDAQNYLRKITQTGNKTAYTNSAGNHSHTLTINSAGESGTGKNLPPYYALAYIMKS